LHETNTEVWPRDVQFSGKEQVLITTAGPWVLDADDIRATVELPYGKLPDLSPQFPYQRWEWHLSDTGAPKRVKDNVWQLSTTAHNIIVDNNGTIHLTGRSANEGEGSAEGELALPPTGGSPIKFVSLKFGNNRLSTLSTDGTVQVVAVSPLDWPDVVRNAKKMVASWDEDLQKLKPKERKRLGLDETCSNMAPEFMKWIWPAAEC
jgi:hypothetical protein